MKLLIDSLLHALNAFDVDGALALFASCAVIDDVSVGDAFTGTEGIRRYLEQFFLGYQTVSKVLAVTQLDDVTAIVRVDFTGDFGHETGSLRIRKGAGGLIERIDASLE